MKQLKIYTLLILLGLVPLSIVSAQGIQLKGLVFSIENGQPRVLPHAFVRWAGTSTVAESDSAGQFSIDWNVMLPATLVASYPGYTDAPMEVQSLSQALTFYLKPSVDLKEVEVKGTRDDLGISTMKTLHVEEITHGELLKAACCNVSESFETNPSVDVNFTDAVSGAKEIQLLGLSGNYTQLLTENIPSITGLAIPYGLTFIPGPWLESIQVSKGAGSVANGSQAITGQINLELLKPEKADKFFLNVYGDDEGRVEMNTSNRFTLDDHWKYLVMAHADYAGMRSDHNGDGFMDQPLSRQMNLYNRFQYHSGKKLEAQFGIKALLDDKVGGELHFNPSEDKGTTNRYGFGITTKRMEVYSKTGFVYPETPYKSMGLQADAVLHKQTSYFGLTTWDGTERTVYLNYSYINILGTTTHKYKVGGDVRLDKLEEQLDDSLHTRNEQTAGGFAEYTFGNDSLRTGVVLGLRGEYSNLYGWNAVPRVHFKYNFTPTLILRISGGLGLRTPNPIADQIAVLASSRKRKVINQPEQEKAWNGGVNLTKRFTLLQREGTLSLDVYSTRFVNQYIADYFSSTDTVYFFNLRDKSYANSLQATFNYEFLPNTEVRIAWKQDDVTIAAANDQSQRRPMVAAQKALLHFSWKSKHDLWRATTTLVWEGAKQLPLTVNTVHDHGAGKESPAYFQLHAQITRIFRGWECYVGGENLLNYTQHDPVIGANDPFGSNFDATRVWGPVMGIKIYGGIRLSIPN